MTTHPPRTARPALTGLLILSLCSSLAAAQTNQAQPVQTPPVQTPPIQTPTNIAPTNTAPTNTAPTNIAAPLPTTPPVAPVAPNTSRLYAGFSVAPSLSGGGTAYGIVVGSTQVFRSFGAQIGVDYDTRAAALSVDALVLYRPLLSGRFSKLLPYAGAGVGLTSSPSSALADPSKPATDPVNLGKTATDYAGQFAAGGDYLLTDSITAGAEVSYRAPFSNKGVAAGEGLRARVGLKFLF
ncbi:hypothetical protein [Deinococcus sp.]|uniref:outer membrane protein n=1 Tax=Deinococcus sp. TaxID=47478 RepID=UPI0025FE7382|nr:hypothetical protein [Deinococcus sp.]